MRRLYKKLPFGLPRLLFQLWLNAKGFWLLLATLLGCVPSHSLRLLGYRTLFGMQIGRKSTLHWQCRFFDPHRIRIGENTLIGNRNFLDGRNGLSIGDCVITASEVAIYTMQHAVDDPDFGIAGGAVVIEDYAYIGSRVTILPDVRIGRGAVVATGAVVTADVAPYTLVGGVPAKFIRERSADLHYKPTFRMPFQ